MDEWNGDPRDPRQAAKMLPEKDSPYEVSDSVYDTAVETVCDTLLKLLDAKATEPMIQAGLKILAESGRIIEGVSPSDRVLVEELFRAMLQCGGDGERTDG